MREETEKQQQVIYPVILPKAFAPQKDRVNHADAVNDYGQQEKVPVKMMILGGEPHGDSLNPLKFLASRNYRRKLYFPLPPLLKLTPKLPCIVGIIDCGEA